MGVVSGIVSALKVGLQVFAAIKAIAVFYQKYKDEKWFRDIVKVYADLEKAAEENASDEERKKALANYLRHMAKL